MTEKRCPCTVPDRAICNGCGHAWCERCDPSPAALCHWCHGRGHSPAELEPVEPFRSIVMPETQSPDRPSMFSHSGDDPCDWRVVANVEGWGWFNDREIQRDDERNEFASDLHATMHVITRAVADEESPHMAFLKFWRAEAPEAYMDTMCAILGSIPGFSIIDERPKVRELLDVSGYDVDWNPPCMDDDDGIGHARLTPQEAYDEEHPPLADDPMDTER